MLVKVTVIYFVIKQIRSSDRIKDRAKTGRMDYWIQDRKADKRNPGSENSVSNCFIYTHYFAISSSTCNKREADAAASTNFICSLRF